MYQWNCCRICLSVESLNPIFSISEQSEKFSEIILKTAGIKIEINDMYPKVICTECVNFINQSTRFRHKAQMTQTTLSERLNSHLFDVKAEPEQTLNTDAHKIASIDITEYSESIDSHNYEGNNDTVFEKTETSDDNTDALIEFVSKIEDLPDKTIDFHFDSKKPSKNNKGTKTSKTKKPVRKRISSKKQNLENDQPCNENTTNSGESQKETKLQDKRTKVKETVQDKKTKVKEAIECKYCDKILTSKLSLRNHYKIHTGFDIVCEHCGKKFITRRLLLMHCRAKHGYEKTDKCSYCDYTASNAEQVKIHERLHTGEKPYACAECGAGFHRKSSYLQHVAIHLPEKTVQCVQCPALFKSVTLMRIHLSRHKRPQYRYGCRVCGGAFARRRNVVRHLQRIHALAAAPAHLERVKIV